MPSQWSEIREKFSGVEVSKPKKGNHLERVLRELGEYGFLFADAEMEEVYNAYVERDESFWDNRKSTYPSIKRTQPDEHGFYAYGTHDRSEDIFSAIERMAELHADEIREGRAWLMPVDDNEEYVSWEFDVMVGSRGGVMTRLRDLVPAG